MVFPQLFPHWRHTSGLFLVLSSSLLTINDLASVLPSNVWSSLNVDDFAIACASTDCCLAVASLQCAVDCTSNWAISHGGFKFSVAKTHPITFTRCPFILCVGYLCIPVMIMDISMGNLFVTLVYYAAFLVFTLRGFPWLPPLYVHPGSYFSLPPWEVPVIHICSSPLLCEKAHLPTATSCSLFIEHFHSHSRAK